MAEPFNSGPTGFPEFPIPEDRFPEWFPFPEFPIPEVARSPKIIKIIIFFWRTDPRIFCAKSMHYFAVYLAIFSAQYLAIFSNLFRNIFRTIFSNIQQSFSQYISQKLPIVLCKVFYLLYYVQGGVKCKTDLACKISEMYLVGCIKFPVHVDSHF